MVGSFVFVDREEVKDEVEIGGGEGILVTDDQEEEFERGGSESYAVDGDLDWRSEDARR